jgi:transcriptional regulator with XRE-family HTH domain
MDRKPNNLLRSERKKRGLSQGRLAELIDADPSMVSRWESGARGTDAFYQEKLCKFFGKDAIELGFIEGAQETAPFFSTPGAISLLPTNGSLVAFFESTLAAQWDLYYMGGAKRAANGLSLLIKEIESLTHLAQGTIWHKQALVLLTMVYQLQSCILRDKMLYPQAHAAYQRAFDVAQELEDLELMASALAREGVTLIQQDKAKQALLYLDNALNIVGELNLPKLKGYLLQAFSEANAQDRRERECWDSIDQAESIVVQPTQERSLVRFNTTAVVAQKGVDAVLLKDYKGAIRLINNSLSTYDPTGIRGRARLIAQRAEAYYGIGILDACIESAKEALVLARSVESSKTIIRIDRLRIVLEQSPWKNEASVAQLGAILNHIEK